jgi:hypothetical protein
MPIRLNLLSEAHAEEELRRRDPVKRVVLSGACAVLLLLAWSSSLQVRAMMAKGDLSNIESQLNSQTNFYSQVMANQRKLSETRHKLAALSQLARTRFLQAPVLNALQRTTLDNVQLTRLRTEQAYALIEATKAVTNSPTKITPGKPARVTERITITLDARDTADSPGDQVPRFKQEITANDYFKMLLGATNEVKLASLSPPTVIPPGKQFVNFSLECRLPERTR